MITLYDGKKFADISMLLWNGNGWSDDWSKEFFNVNSFPYNPTKNAYFVPDVECRLDFALEWIKSSSDVHLYFRIY